MRSVVLRAGSVALENRAEYAYAFAYEGELSGGRAAISTEFVAFGW